MSLATFMSDNLIDNCQLTLVTGTSNSQFPLDNIKHVFSTKVFRSTGTSCSILIDTFATNVVDIIALRGSTVDGIGFTSATIEGSATPVFSGTPISIEVSNTYNFAFKELTLSTHRYWKLVLTGSTYVELSNIFIGQKVQMQDNNIDMGFSYTLNTNSKITTNTYGMKFVDEYNKLKQIKGSVKFCNSIEFDQLNDIHNNNGDNKPIWFMLDSLNSLTITNSKFLFSGMFYLSDLTWTATSQELFDVNLVFTEAA
jgi:hypothetical protein